MTRVASFEESVAVGNKLLVGFQQALGLLRRPPLDTKSKMVKKILKANMSKKILSYFDAGCINVHDSAESMSNCPLGRVVPCACFPSDFLTTNFFWNVAPEALTCRLELQEHINGAKTILDESECLLADATVMMQNSNESFLTNGDIVCDDVLPDQAIISDNGETSEYQIPERVDYATMMAIIYNMMKQDFLMQERIVAALDLKLPSEELDSYCLMWSLRPFINDELMHEAWKLVH